MQIPVALERLVYEFSRFPGVGRKTAQRLAFSILRYSQEETQNLADALTEVKEKIRYCSVCSGFTDIDPCTICSHAGRDHEQVCVVEQPNNIFQIEKSGVFKGVYHVLMGAISPLDGIGPEQLNIRNLSKRVEESVIKELIIATNPTVKGEATALFLQQEFSGKIQTITRLACGIPAGGDLEYVDDVTLIEAFSGRHKFYN
ncbi:MAG TPA: recombination protein RecR [Candidatus Lambdaproteobacteria bacterium]|nr:recombination mediator RecR [SAR324 cluster bacterium]HBL56620.1 recombination protein RecR [Deltaproteobacteria bacterium]HIA56352.1 recombination protein RecR [Candidatus Lambdaproteobacteria bacterium]HIB46492.1 recombination protein RecR [Candidatus Lambdaproteobacteria bacterium]HIB93237.1 recombination protein RecR [Candidatus Lambdaproteobacteria bacterium]